MLKVTQIHSGWDIEHDANSYTKYFLKHCNTIVSTNEGTNRDIKVKCKSCNQYAPDSIMAVLYLCRWE